MKSAIRLTYSHEVTKEELIKSLEKTLKMYGCEACGLNGFDRIELRADPDPIFKNVSQVMQKDFGILVEKVEPTQQQIGQNQRF